MSRRYHYDDANNLELGNGREQAPQLIVVSPAAFIVQPPHDLVAKESGPQDSITLTLQEESAYAKRFKQLDTDPNVSPIDKKAISQNGTNLEVSADAIQFYSDEFINVLYAFLRKYKNGGRGTLPPNSLTSMWSYHHRSIIARELNLKVLSGWNEPFHAAEKLIGAKLLAKDLYAELENARDAYIGTSPVSNVHKDIMNIVMTPVLQKIIDHGTANLANKDVIRLPSTRALDTRIDRLLKHYAVTNTVKPLTISEWADINSIVTAKTATIDNFLPTYTLLLNPHLIHFVSDEFLSSVLFLMGKEGASKSRNKKINYLIAKFGLKAPLSNSGAVTQGMLGTWVRYAQSPYCEYKRSVQLLISGTLKYDTNKIKVQIDYERLKDYPLTLLKHIALSQGVPVCLLSTVTADRLRDALLLVHNYKPADNLTVGVPLGNQAYLEAVRALNKDNWYAGVSKEEFEKSKYTNMISIRADKIVSYSDAWIHYVYYGIIFGPQLEAFVPYDNQKYDANFRNGFVRFILDQPQYKATMPDVRWGRA